MVALLTEEFQHLRRRNVRSAEIAVMAEYEPGSLRTLTQQKRALAQLEPLLSRSYPVLDGEERELRFMTRVNLQARIDMLGAQEEGVRRSREAAERVLALCEAANVDCLADLEEVA